MTRLNTAIKKLPLILSLFFLFNPNITVFDFLPDFIGYLLLCIAIFRLSDLNDHVYEAYKIFRRMIFIDAAKLLSIVWIFGMTVPGERNTSLLLFTFVFSVLELICLIPAYSKLFYGFMQIGYLVPNSCIFGSKTGRAEVAKRFSIALVIAKAVLNVLPEFADLTSRTYDMFYESDLPMLYDYITLMRTLAFIPVLIIGIVWLIIVLVFFIRVIKDKAFLAAVDEKYRAEVLPRNGLFIRRYYATFVLMATVAICLSIDFRIDFYNIIPDILSALMFVVAFVYLRRIVVCRNKIWLMHTVFYIVSSVISMCVEYYFFSEYYYGAIIRNDTARLVFIIMVVLNAIKSAAFIAVIISMCSVLMDAVKAHTGSLSLHKTESDPVRERLNSSLHNELKKYLTGAVIATVIYGVSDLCYDLLTSEVKLIGTVNVVCGCVCVGMFIRALGAIRAEINTKYMLD